MFRRWTLVQPTSTFISTLSNSSCRIIYIILIVSNSTLSTSIFSCWWSTCSNIVWFNRSCWTTSIFVFNLCKISCSIIKHRFYFLLKIIKHCFNISKELFIFSFLMLPFYMSYVTLLFYYDFDIDIYPPLILLVHRLALRKSCCISYKIHILTFMIKINQ